MKKVIIIGAGASGVLTAIYLKKYIDTRITGDKMAE